MSEEDTHQNDPPSIALTNFKRHLRDAFNVNGSVGVDTYISGTTEQLRKQDCYLLIERGHTTGASPSDPALQPGDYGEIKLRAADGSRVSFRY